MLALLPFTVGSSALAALRGTPGVRYVPPELALRSLPRDVAVAHFHPMAEELTRPGAGVLAVLAPPPGLPLAHRRLLQRTVLALGGVALHSLCPAGLRWETTGEPGRDLPAPWVGSPAELATAGELGWPNRGPGAGAFRRGVCLLVGERPGVARSGQLKHRLPFVSFDGNGCAGWLAEQLENAGVSEADLYWINAYDALSFPTNSSFVDALQPTQIIALGKEASRWCKASHLPHRCVPHPQYWKRFRSKERYPLLDVL